MKLFTTFAVALLSALPVLAADCYSDQVDGSVALYQSIASYVCSGAKCGTSSNPCSAASASKKGFITGYATGNSKNHCVVNSPNILLLPSLCSYLTGLINHRRHSTTSLRSVFRDTDKVVVRGTGSKTVSPNITSSRPSFKKRGGLFTNLERGKSNV